MGSLTARLVFVLAALWLGVAAPAMAGPDSRGLRCGDTITSDTRLVADLVNCPDGGLIIGSDGVTLDLNGHRIDGRSSGHAIGIDVRGHSDVTIHGGSVHRFSEDVFALNAGDITVRDVTVAGAGHAGILVDGAGGATISGNTARHDGAGIVITRSEGAWISDNHVTDSSSGGIAAFESRQVVIAGNTVTASRTDMAIGLVRGTSESAVLGNQVSQSGAGVVVAGGAAKNLVAGNVLRHNGSGVILDVGTHTNRLVDNRIEDSAFEGIAVVGSDRDVIAQNHVLRSGQAVRAAGIAVIPWPDDATHTADGNRVIDNVVLRTHGDGIIVGRHQTGNVLRGNHADDNTRLGILAAPGTIDGGGNLAAHNGDPRQCVGVACASAMG